MQHFARQRIPLVPGSGLAVAAVLILAPAATAQGVGAQLDSLRREMARLQQQVDSLHAVVRSLRAGEAVEEPVDELAALRAAAAAAAGADTTEAEPEAEPKQFVGRQRSQQALNPEFTVTGDVFAFVDVDRPEQNNWVPREFEFSMQAALDPFSRAKVFVGRHVPGGEILPFEHHEDGGAGEEEQAEEGGFAVEEGYVEWVGLPAGLGLSFGRFRQWFGQLNRWHPHALPGQTYPLPYLAFFGEEGLAQTGVSAHWLLPVSGFGTYEVWGEVTSSSNTNVFGEARRPSVVGRFNAFWDLSRSTYFEVGVSTLAGPYEGLSSDGTLRVRSDWGTRVHALDFALSWRPPERSRYREATLRGGALLGHLGNAMEPEDALGCFGIGEFRLNRKWVVGGRYEFTENPLDPTETAWLVAPTLTWWQSEWVRIRAEFDYLERPDETLQLFVLQATFSMGPHKHETY